MNEELTAFKDGYEIGWAKGVKAKLGLSIPLNIILWLIIFTAGLLLGVKTERNNNLKNNNHEISEASKL